MGRSAYTPATISYLVSSPSPSRSTSGNATPSTFSSGSSRSPSRGVLSYNQIHALLGRDGDDDEEEDKPEVAPSSSLSEDEHAHAGVAATVGALSSNATSNNPKDTPMAWSQHSFDPDDESLPVVNERFVQPGEQEDLEENEADADETVASEYDNDDSQFRPDTSRQEAGPLVLENGFGASALNGPEEDDETDQDEEGDDVDDDEYDDYNDDTRMDNSAYSQGEAPITPASQQHAIGSMAARTTMNEQVSPSMGVFHTYTLPFSLPAAEDMQRRSVQSTHAVTPSSAAISVASY